MHLRRLKELRRDHRVSWLQCSIIIVASAALGIALFMNPYPLWLAPPLIRFTHVVYSCLSLAWFPLFLFCWWLRPSGSRIIPIILGLLSVPLLLCFGLFLSMTLLWSFGSGQDCTVTTRINDSITYSCDITVMADYGQYRTFTASPHSPFMTLTDE